MRLCPRNIAFGAIGLGLVLSLVGLPMFGVPMMLIGAAAFLLTRRGRRRPRRPRRRR